MLGLYLCLKPSGTEPLVGSLCWYEPAAAKFLPTRHELADDKRQAGARAVASEAGGEAHSADRKDASQLDAAQELGVRQCLRTNTRTSGVLPS